MAIAILLLATATPALACPPPPPGYQPPSAEEILRMQTAGSPNIVYAVVEQAIQPEGSLIGRINPGVVRILHVYKSHLHVGERIRMYGETFNTDCGSGTYDREEARAGSFGVLMLGEWDGHQALGFLNFIDRETVGEMIRLGLIESARGGHMATGPAAAH